jgi:signal transduction histidine kinase
MDAEQRRNYTDVIYRNGKRMLRLVGDMLFVAKARAGRIDLEVHGFDPAAVARECVERFAPRAERGGVELRAEIEETGKITGDAGRVGQAIDNLISNAIKFTPRGGRATVSVTRNGAEAVTISVADTGLGISAADQERLFERFFRSANVTEKSIEGTGLGLTIVEAIVHGHGGRISVQSAEGEGTTFAIALPVDGAPTDAPIVGTDG